MNLKQIPVQRYNPEMIAKPVGNYSHVTKIERNAELYVFSGQIGIDQDNHIPADFNEQVTNTMNNIVAILSSQQLTPDHVIKINIWATEEIDWDHFYEKWNAVFGPTSPSMTVAYIQGLGLPELKIELDVWAAG
ncbi:enamine deaminase RidA [Bacillus sp. FJAT-27264]|uniref:RidA family protein n=1 Tax=Paenibacillus sp. (strain DSM 101736 / FJAT-27264) TaxID=1850362 RepID=UPI000807C7E1|nr:RidA family protein [Bacillus sp. FJAT-27264]OBZ08371.1 enamine deaminase RidA [Bacillus sp. FJAT-27264]